jgi:hypothetical protein
MFSNSTLEREEEIEGQTWADSVFRNYTSVTFLVASDRGRGVLKASWSGPSSFLKRSGPTKLPD